MKKITTTVIAIAALTAFAAPVVASLATSPEQACGGEKPASPKPEKPKPEKPKPIQPS